MALPRILVRVEGCGTEEALVESERVYRIVAHLVFQVRERVNRLDVGHLTYHAGGERRLKFELNEQFNLPLMPD